MAIYAIGDIQGCFAQLQSLLTKLQFNRDEDTLWLAGDIVNRGPHSLHTLRFIRSLGKRAVTVLGNHDLHLLAVANGRGKQSKKDTFKDILEAEDRDELLDWLIHQPLMHYDKELDVCLCHAGIYPQWSIHEALQYAGELQDILRSPKSHEFFHHMYGDKPPTWCRHLKGWDRLRFITNTFTRMRYCDAQGRLFLREKSAPGKQDKGIHPWFEIADRKTQTTNIIFGHWSTLTDPQQKHLYPLDTGCLWGGQLTALKIDRQLTEKITIQCPQAQPVNIHHGYKTLQKKKMQTVK
jgi:bis(5'-nucleosyl)-tetraphosphatase (symmetrical)